MTRREMLLAAATLGLALFAAVRGFGVDAGATQAVAASHEKRISSLETFKDETLTRLGGMDGKLDALLDAQGVTYRPARRP